MPKSKTLPLGGTFNKPVGTESVVKCSSLTTASVSDSTIIKGDVINVLSSLNKRKKFDVIIADPPYNIGKNFGNNKDQREIEEYVRWSKEWINLCFEFLSKNGLMYIYGVPEVLARIAVEYPIENQRWLVWHYTNKTTPSSNFWQRSHESILCLWRDQRPQLEVDQIREPYTESYKKIAGRKRADTNGRFGDKETTYNVHKNGALPRDVIKIPALAGGAGKVERWFICRDCRNRLYPPKKIKDHKGHNILQHPTQKPMQLTEKLIRSCINGNSGRTLIPFAGSGSECVVAQSLGVDFLGIELNPEYVIYARKWLKEYPKNQNV